MPVIATLQKGDLVMDVPNGMEYLAASLSRSVDSASGIHSKLQTLLFSGKYADLAIVCGDRKFKAHRAIVCPQSGFFAKGCKGAHAKPILIELCDFKPKIMNHVLQFLYTGKYEDGSHPRSVMPSTVGFTELMLPGDVGGICDPMASYGEENGHDDDDEDGDDTDDDGSECSVRPDESETINGNQAPKDLFTSDDKNLTGAKPDMLTSLRVYMMANFLDIPALEKLSLTKLWLAMRDTNLRSAKFRNIVDEIYKTTKDTDQAIRDVPCRLLAAAHCHDKLDMETMEPLMRKHSDLAIGILKFTTRFRAAGRDLHKVLDEEMIDEDMSDDGDESFEEESEESGESG